jgi:hypothetical protein
MQEVLHMSSWSELCLIGPHITSQAVIMVARVDALVDQTVDLAMTVAHPVMQCKDLSVFSDHM